MGRFLSDDDKSNPHDNSDIMRCKTEANEIKVKLQAVKDKLAEHEDSLFYENTGKLRTGLGCHHNFKSVKRHEIKYGIERDVDHFIGDLDRVSGQLLGYL